MFAGLLYILTYFLTTYYISFTHSAVLDGAVARPVSPAAAGVADVDDYGETHNDGHHNEGLPEKRN